MRRDLERVRDMLEAIANIERYAARGYEVFEAEELIQVWMVHNLQIIGEAARSISDQFREEFSAVPWVPIIGFRNLVVHEYFRVDLSVVWNIVVQDIPELQVQIAAILAALEDYDAGGN
jgi:uncharacterized protein with HEPN domain